MIPEGQNYLENSQWLIVDLRLSRHDEGTYLKLPSLGREIEEQDRVLVGLGQLRRTWWPTSYIFLACLIPKSTHQDNLTGHEDLVTTRRGV